MLQDIKIREMSKEEYFYLTENLEIVDKDTICNGVQYILYNKKKRLLDVVHKVLQNELTENERRLATDYWSGEKLEASLKYVLIYDSDALPQSANELMSFIKETQIEQREKVN